MLAHPGPPLRRKKVTGAVRDVADVLSLLPALRADPGLSDGLRVASLAARFALELAGRQAVVPDVVAGHARWRALLARRADRARFEALVAALPVSVRMEPTEARGQLRLLQAEVVVRELVDAFIDALYRTGAHPGPGRGWALELAHALREQPSTFQPTDARSVGVPAKLAAWSRDDGTNDLRVGVELTLPAQRRADFGVSLWVHPSDAPEVRRPLAEAWNAGPELDLGERSVRHPAYASLAAMARARRIFPPLGEALAGRAPRGISWNATAAWRFLHQGVRPLQDAGFEVRLPEGFSATGTQRLRARMRIEVDEDGLELGAMLRYRWEVVLGDLVLDGNDFAALTQSGEPIVRFRDEWVLLDPAELARLPEGLPQEGRLDAASALRAVLTGQHEGVPVVADDRLKVVLDALRSPPDVPPPPELRATLRPYQARGYAWLTTLGALGLGACLADDMGLGKTIQLIAHVLKRRSGRAAASEPVLVVCPTSLLGNWSRELARFAPTLRVARHHGLQRDLSRARARADVVLTTYGLLARDAEVLASVPWDVVALDEAQAIKNPDAQRAKAAYRLQARHRVALSGTPVENRLEELWSIMHFLVPGLLGTRARFKRQVAIPVERLGDEDAAERLRLGVSPFLLRRVKSDPDVAGDLPEKIEKREYVPVTREQARLYEEAAGAFLERIKGAPATERRGHVLAMLTALKQICNHPSHYLKDARPTPERSGKLDRVVHLLETVFDNGERAIVFTQYREMGDRLVTAFKAWYGFTAPFLHGGVSSDGRDEMVRAFQEDDDAPPVMIISLRAGGTGLNLTRATHVVHYDRWWNPAVEDQATDRAYRIGQKHNVQVHKLICQDTLEERIDALLEEKRSLADAVVGSGDSLVAELDDAALAALVALGEDAVMEEG